MNSAYERLLQLPLIGILRNCRSEHLPQIIEAVIQGGMLNLEITMNSSEACSQIERAVQLSEARLNIGAGTVTSLETLDAALTAGATFIVMPFLHERVVRSCVERQIPVLPGALSPTEIHRAAELGATMIKVFPAESGGASFIRGLKGPFPEIKLLPTGGVDLTTLPELIRAGAAGAGIGSPLFAKERMESCDWNWLQQQVNAFVTTYRRAKAIQ